MKTISLNILAGAALATIVNGLPNHTDLLSGLSPAPAGDPRFTDWQAPGPNDVRSPCPGLNALANHNFIHRDGRNMTLPHLIDGLASGMNIGADFTTLIGALGLLSSPFPLGGYFDLNDLAQHNFPIEHDGSLSRQDAYFGNDYTFNQSIFNQVLSYYSGMDNTSTLQASKARFHRIQDSFASNPTTTYGLKEFILSSGETGLYVQTMSSPLLNSAPVEYVKSFFENEKLPYDLGWRPSPQPITLLSLGEYVFELFLANRDNLVEGATITAQSYKDGIELLVGGTEVLANLTSGLSELLGL